MIKNYFILNRIILELNSLLKGYVITEIFSQEKNNIILKCENKISRYIDINVNPGEPYITIRNEFHRAKKNSINFFVDSLPAEITEFRISDHDRLIQIQCESVSFYFAVRGKHTNFLMVDSAGGIDSFKDEEEPYLEEFKGEIPDHKFISEKNRINFQDKDLDFDEYRKKYPFLGKEIIAEARYRYNDKNDKKSSVYIDEITDEILSAEPAVFYSSGSDGVFLAVKSFHMFPAGSIKIFDSITEAVNFYIGKKYYLDQITSKRKIVGKFIDRELSKLSTKMNDLKIRIDRGSREEEYNKIGSLLLINLKNIPVKSSSVEIEDIYENNRKIKVKLDPKLTPQKNAEYYFTKAGNEKIAYKKSSELFRNVSENYMKLLLIKDKFEKIDNLEEIKSIMKELKIKSGEKRSTIDDIKSKFKHYIIDDKYDVFVGKDSANNDLLTMKFAKQNDYWFHARSVPGSHVVLRVVNTKETIPRPVLKSAAAVAAFHSKAKTSGLAPVSYTLKKYVTKKKGMEPGKVILLKEEVLLVKPGIPSNCEFVSGE